MQNLLESPFHVGEQILQEQLGVREKMERFGRKVIRDYMPGQHREFYNELPFVFVSHADSQGNSWASILPGSPGFISSRNSKSLEFSAKPLKHDPLAENLVKGLDMGLLGINLSNRRRNRLSSRVNKVTDKGFELGVRQSFGNCPKYITVRTMKKLEDKVSKSTRISKFNREHQYVIITSDTFFVSSYVKKSDNSASDGSDVSHRGGRPGFIRYDDDKTLTIPDYSGNFHFNTLGNFLINPSCGLLFIDFDYGNLLTLTGKAEILLDSSEQKEFPGAERLWRFHLDHGYWIENALNFTMTNF